MSEPIFNSLKKISYLIRFYRRQKNISQIEMANDIGISFRNLQRLENGEVEPKLETLNKIASYMQISISSLIRPTDGQILSIREHLTSKEYYSFKDFNLKSMLTLGDIKFVQNLVKDDQQERPRPELGLYAALDGTSVVFSSKLGKLTGITSKYNNVDSFVVTGSCMERWEYVFRAKMKQAHIENHYLFPNGFKVFEEFHFNLRPNPEAPTSECFIRDVTSRYELEQWLRMIHL